MDKRGINKRGQEGVTLTTLLLIVLGAVVVAIIIIGFTTGFDFIFGKIGSLPGQDLQTVVTGCELAAANGLRADYCATFKEVEINGEKQFLTCDSDLVKSNMDPDVERLSCEGTPVEDFCRSTNQVRESEWDTILVNGRTCMEVTNDPYESRSSVVESDGTLSGEADNSDNA